MDGRKYLITIKMNEDCSEYNLVCLRNGQMFKKKIEYSMGDALIDLYDFEQGIYEEEEVDTRFDDFRVKIDIYC